MSRKDEQFMTLCKFGAELFSTCGKRQYMAILVNRRNHIVGMGYNGGPAGFEHCSEGGCPRFLEGSPPGSNYDNCISIHAEQNAFLNAVSQEDNLKLYINGTPCFGCAKVIANSRVLDLYYIPDDTYAQLEYSLEYLNNAGVNTYACQ